MIQIDLIKADPRYEGVKLCQEQYADMIAVAKGSGHNHQAWPGGYVDHINQCFDIARTLYVYRPHLPFKLESALIVLFFHDFEKIWKDTNRPFHKHNFLKYTIREEYNIELTDEEWNAIEYVHGEGNDYRKDKRVMNELAAFCHACDIISARCFHSKRF